MLVISYYVYVNLVDESTCFNADRLWCSLPIYNGVLVDRHLNLVAFVGTICSRINGVSTRPPCQPWLPSHSCRASLESLGCSRLSLQTTYPLISLCAGRRCSARPSSLLLGSVRALVARARSLPP